MLLVLLASFWLDIAGISKYFKDNESESNARLKESNVADTSPQKGNN